MSNALTHRRMIKRFFHSFNFSIFRLFDFQTFRPSDNFIHMKQLSLINEIIGWSEPIIM